jgi:4-hydroxy-tetrahydrodipicolinate synthase
MQPFEGIFPVLLTPYSEGAPDAAGIRHLVDHLVDSGVHGLVVLGSNGENPYLTDEEKRRVIDVALESARGRIPMIVGTGCMGTDATIGLTRYARQAGADAALVAMPQYFPLDFGRVKAHFGRVAREGGLPLLYYHFPAVTHLALSPEQIAEIAAIENVVGVKESILDVEAVSAVAASTDPASFSVLSGTVLTLPALVPRGIVGAICILPNLIPRECVALYEALRKQDAAKGGALTELVQKFVPLVTRPASQALLKEALRQMGHPVDPAVKDPLPPLSAEDRALVSQVLASAKPGAGATG